jgi:hypothetical protein
MSQPYQTPQTPSRPRPNGAKPEHVLAGVLCGLLVLGLIAVAVGRKAIFDAVADPPPVVLQESVIVNEFFTLKDGTASTWRIPPGRYRVEMTATNDGASVAWTGAACQVAKETRVFNSNCNMPQIGQLTIGNPTTFGLGADTSVTLTVTHLP